MNKRLEELIVAAGPEAEGCLENILVELLRARTKHPDWPSDPVHASAVINEEAGELTQAALDFYYSCTTEDDMAAECIQTAAMSLRFLMHLHTYRRREQQA